MVTVSVGQAGPTAHSMRSWTPYLAHMLPVLLESSGNSSTVTTPSIPTTPGSDVGEEDDQELYGNGLVSEVVQGIKCIHNIAKLSSVSFLWSEETSFSASNPGTSNGSDISTSTPGPSTIKRGTCVI